MVEDNKVAELREHLINNDAERQKHVDIVHPKTLHNAFKCNKNFSIVQMLCFISLLYSFWYQGYISYNLYLFELEPEYLCKYTAGSEFVKCTTNDLKDAKEWEFDTTGNNLNLNNWFTRLRFQNYASWQIGLIGTIYFFGYIWGSIYFPRLADVYGRKPFVVIGGFMQSFSTLALIFSPNIEFIYLNMFIIGIASPFLSSIGYNYLIELIPEFMENPVNTMIMCIDAFGSLLGILFFTYVSVEVDSFLIIVSVLGIMSSLFHWITPESPVFADNTYQQDNTNEVIISSPRSEAERMKTSVWDFFTNKTLFLNITVMVWVWSTTSAGYYLINFNMKYVGGNMMNNISASVISEILASLVASVIFSYVGAKTSLILFFFISGAAAGIGWYEFSDPFIITVLILVMKFGVAAAYCLIYITTARIFPSVYAATAFGICNIFARITTAFTPIIVELPHPASNLFLCLTCFFVCISIQFLDDKRQRSHSFP